MGKVHDHKTHDHEANDDKADDHETDNGRASNQEDLLHDEAYGVSFDRRNLDHRGALFMGGRETIALDGAWSFTTDRFDTGLRQRWYEDCHLPIEGRTRPWDYDLARGQTIQVPGCWNIADPHYWFFEGTAWYGRSFADPRTRPDDRLILRIGAANYEAKIFLNGRFLGSHRGGSTPIFADLTSAMETENRLMIAVNNERSADAVPMGHIDWFNYGGLFREVDLIPLPAVHIKDLFVHLLPDGSFRRIALKLRIDGAQTALARLSIPALGIDEPLKVEDGRGEMVIEAAPDLWSPARPVLYDIKVALGDDDITDRVGFREIRTEGQRILLNGEAIKLKGIAVHEDDEASGRVSDEADLRRRFAHAKELGANFLRLAHYPHHERAAVIADEEGLLLWEEIPVYWSIDFGNEATYRDAKNQLKELILRDRNRASVIAWGIGNENPDTEARLAFMERLARTARKSDPSRLIGAACLVNKAARRLEDRLADHLDLVGINAYYGWYEKEMADLEAILDAYRLDKPLIITEMGADALAGREGSIDQLFSEAQMDGCYAANLEIVGRSPVVQGLCPWILYDFRSERRQNSFQRGWNRKGLIAADKTTKKRAFKRLQAFYQDRRWAR